jgi:TPP-dependent 2-oxoacid decarboxylase
MANTMKKATGSFLIDRLVSLGISHLCGVPGDYNLEFLKLLAVYEIRGVLRSADEISARLRRSASQP